MRLAVIGGGLAGLSAAIEAAKCGAEATLYDARESLGGRARTRVRDGFQLNEGAHALYVDGEAMAFLRELGCEPAGGVPAASGGIGIDGALAGPLPSGAWSLLRTPLLRGERVNFGRLFAKLARLDASDFAEMTVNAAVAELLGHGRASRLGHALFRLSTYGNDPGCASADAGIMQLKYALAGGVRYLDGGWQTIVDSLRTEAVAHGVIIEAGAKVNEVRSHDGGTELQVNGSTHAYQATILAPGSPRLAGQLLGPVAPATACWAASARPSTVASLDVGLGVEWGPGPTFALGIDEPLYLSVHAPVASLADAGQALVHVSRYQKPDETPDTERDRRACEELLDRVRPGWREDAVHVGFHRRLVAASDQPRAERGGLGGRPGPGVPGMTDVYVAGDWVGPEGLLADASIASGRAAARLAT